MHNYKKKITSINAALTGKLEDSKVEIPLLNPPPRHNTVLHKKKTDFLSICKLRTPITSTISKMGNKIKTLL